MKSACAAVLALLALLTTVVPARAADPAIRTLLFHFTYDARGFGGSPFASRGRVHEGANSGTAARSGTIAVSVVKATPDDGLVVDLTETIDRRLRPLETLRCAVYGRTVDVVCDQNLRPTGEEVALLGTLGRFFYEPSRLDAKGHWQSVPHITNALVVTNDYTVTKTDGNLVTLALDREEKGSGYQAVTTGTILYDTAMEVPNSVHLSTDENQSGSQGDMNVDLKLLTDSMAQTSSETSH